MSFYKVKYFTILILFNLVTSLYIQASTSSRAVTSYEKINEKEQEKVKNFVHANISEIAQVFNTPYKHKDEMKYHTALRLHCPPGYHVKFGVDRLAGAKVIKDYIQTQNLFLVTVPEKWLCSIPAQYQTPKCKNFVIAKTLDLAQNQCINLDQAKQVCKVLQHAKYANKFFYYDTNIGNIVSLADGRIGFIDTELFGFGTYSPKRGLSTFLKNHELTDDAQKFVAAELKEAELQYPAPDIEHPEKAIRTYSICDDFVEENERY